MANRRLLDELYSKMFADEAELRKLQSIDVYPAGTSDYDVDATKETMLEERIAFASLLIDIALEGLYGSRSKKHKQLMEDLKDVAGS